mmetsp:Transcript_4486/g.10802  ORF Transcript_4486/g.10802 Transcript_4486/m.10802 type:complete len:213 (+) Transcript_4486:307-945(+)
MNRCFDARGQRTRVIEEGGQGIREVAFQVPHLGIGVVDDFDGVGIVGVGRFALEDCKLARVEHPVVVLDPHAQQAALPVENVLVADSLRVLRRGILLRQIHHRTRRRPSSVRGSNHRDLTRLQGHRERDPPHLPRGARRRRALSCLAVSEEFLVGCRHVREPRDLFEAPVVPRPHEAPRMEPFRRLAVLLVMFDLSHPGCGVGDVAPAGAAA